MEVNIINETNNEEVSKMRGGTIYIFETSQTCGLEVSNKMSCPTASANNWYQNSASRKQTIISVIRTCIWQRGPSAFASLTCVCYGLMWGWPSPTYVKFLGPDAPISLDYAEMAVTAGTLMLGVCIGTPVSSKRTVLGPKYGIVLGNALIVMGWIAMWQAQDKLWLMASRIVLGTGAGFAIGQIKIYIAEMSADSLTITLIKQVNIYVLFGFVMAFAIAPFVQFQTYGLICMIFSSIVFFITIFLPPTPRELVEAMKLEEAKKVLIFLNPECDTEEKTRQILDIKNAKENEMGFTKIMGNSTLRNNFFKLTILGFLAQFSGAPSTLVFTQLFFTNISVPYPYYMSLVYSVLFFLSNLIGIYESPKYNKKSVLLISSLSVSVCLVLKILVILFKLNENYFSHSSLIVMFLFIFSHTIGLGNVPLVLINEFFPKNYRIFVTKYFICLLSMFALISTKIFQVLFFDISKESPFYVFLSVSLFGALFVAVFIPKQIIPVVENMKFINVNIANNLRQTKIENK